MKYLLCLMVAAAVTSVTLSDFVTTVEVVYFSAEKGQTAAGKCCDLAVAATHSCDCPACTKHAHCDYNFKICTGAPNSATCKTAVKETGNVVENQDVVFFNLTGDAATKHLVHGPFKDVDSMSLIFNVVDEDSWGNPADFVVKIVEQVNFADVVLDNYSAVKTVVHKREHATDTKLEYRFKVSCATGFSGKDCTTYSFADCNKYFMQGYTKSGIYELGDATQGLFNATCEMETEGGGWTVIQQRESAAVPFEFADEKNETWHKYVDGFGVLGQNSWLGLTYMHLLTKRNASRLRVEITDCKDVLTSQEYDEFQVGPPEDFYRLTLKGAGTGAAGDSMLGSHANNGMQFTTKGVDHDKYEAANCAKMFPGGWWFNDCTAANLNGVYDPLCESYEGLVWVTAKNTLFFSAKTTRMMIKPL